MSSLAMSGDVPTVRWITAFLDTARESAEVSETFWSRVTGYHVSPSRGERDEFATLLPPSGDAHLKVQRVVQTPPGGLHIDLHTDDVRALAHRAEDLGASASYLDLGYVVCGSPGGMTCSEQSCRVPAGSPARRIIDVPLRGCGASTCRPDPVPPVNRTAAM